MKKPKLDDFKREVYDGQDYADWYKDYYQALEKYVDELEQALRIHDVVGRSEQLLQNFCTLNQQTCGKGSACKYPHCHL